MSFLDFLLAQGIDPTDPTKRLSPDAPGTQASNAIMLPGLVATVRPDGSVVDTPVFGSAESYAQTPFAAGPNPLAVAAQRLVQQREHPAEIARAAARRADEARNLLALSNEVADTDYRVRKLTGLEAPNVSLHPEHHATGTNLPDLRRAEMRTDAVNYADTHPDAPHAVPFGAQPWQMDPNAPHASVGPDTRGAAARTLDQQRTEREEAIRAEYDQPLVSGPMDAARMLGDPAEAALRILQRPETRDFAGGFSQMLTGGYITPLAARIASLHPNISYEEAIAAAHRLEQEHADAEPTSGQIAHALGGLAGGFTQYSALAKMAGPLASAAGDVGEALNTTRAGQMGVQGAFMGGLGGLSYAPGASVEDRLKNAGVAAAQGATFGVVLPAHGAPEGAPEPTGPVDRLPVDPQARRIRFNQRMDESLGVPQPEMSGPPDIRPETNVFGVEPGTHSFPRSEPTFDAVARTRLAEPLGPSSARHLNRMPLPERVRTVAEPQLPDTKRGDYNAPDNRAAVALEEYTGAYPNGENAGGIHFPERLERIVAENGPEAQALDQLFSPVREQMRSAYGDRVRLYRAQRPLNADTTPRATLSWTADPRYAQYHVRASGGEVVSRDVPLDDVLWVTNRQGQAEFIVRNRGDHAIGPQPIPAGPSSVQTVPQGGVTDAFRRALGNEFGAVGGSPEDMRFGDLPASWKPNGNRTADTPAQARAFGQGESAAHNGLARDVNPYEPNTREWRDFERGWSGRRSLLERAGAPLRNEVGGMGGEPEQVVAAAFRAGGTVYPADFNGLVHALPDNMPPELADTAEQGFITNRGRFVTREEASALHGIDRPARSEDVVPGTRDLMGGLSDVGGIGDLSAAERARLSDPRVGPLLPEMRDEVGGTAGGRYIGPALTNDVLDAAIGKLPPGSDARAILYPLRTDAYKYGSVEKRLEVLNGALADDMMPQERPAVLAALGGRWEIGGERAPGRSDVGGVGDVSRAGYPAPPEPTASRGVSRLTRGAAGAVLGAGIGAGADEDNRLRGALAGGVLGAGAGAFAPEIRAGIEGMYEGTPARHMGRVGQGAANEMGAFGDPNAFYSRLDRSINEFPQERGTAQQWQAFLSQRTAKGEREWVGVDQFLRDAAERGESVTREQIRALYDRNAIQLQEVQRGGTPDTFRPVRRADGSYAVENYRTGEVAQEGITGLRAAETANEVARGVNRERGLRPIERDPKYSGYTIPGGENYREVLVTLPQREETGVGYRSSHWEEPNVLLHLRLNDRTLPNGEKVLFVEEVQSDWHQQGRKNGYRDPEPAEREYQQLAEMMRRRTATPEQAMRFVELQGAGAGRAITAVPRAPFSKTEEWLGLGMKRVLDEAAAGGYDRVAWTTGAQQADRYDLSKHISTLYYHPETHNLQALNHKGELVLNGTYAPEQLPDVVGKDVADRLVNTPSMATGDDYATQHGYARLSGVDLRVGGEGMRSFYDRMIPNWVRDYARRIGVKLDVEPVQTSTDDLLASIRRDNPEVARAIDQRIAQGETPENALDWYDRTYFGGTMRNRMGLEGNPSFRVTPELRERIRQGQPIGAANNQVLRAVAGAGAGGLIGATQGDDTKSHIQNALIGAAVGTGVGLAPEVLASIRRVAGNRLGAVGDLSRVPVEIAEPTAESGWRARVVAARSWPPEAYLHVLPDGTAELHMDTHLNPASRMRAMNAFEGAEEGMRYTRAPARVEWNGSSGVVTERGTLGESPSISTPVTPEPAAAEQPVVRAPEYAPPVSEPAPGAPVPPPPPPPEATATEPPIETAEPDGEAGAVGDLTPMQRAARSLADDAGQGPEAALSQAMRQSSEGRYRRFMEAFHAWAPKDKNGNLDYLHISPEDRAQLRAMEERGPHPDYRDLVPLASGDMTPEDFAAKHEIPVEVAQAYVDHVQTLSDPEGYVSPLDDPAYAVERPEEREGYTGQAPPEPRPVDSVPDDSFLPADGAPTGDNVFANAWQRFRSKYGSGGGQMGLRLYPRGPKFTAASTALGAGVGAGVGAIANPDDRKAGAISGAEIGAAAGMMAPGLEGWAAARRSGLLANVSGIGRDVAQNIVPTETVASLLSDPVDALLSLRSGQRASAFRLRGTGEAAWKAVTTGFADMGRKAFGREVSATGKAGAEAAGRAVEGSDRRVFANPFIDFIARNIGQIRGSVDMPSAVGAYTRAIDEQAWLVARNEGLKGGALRARAAELRQAVQDFASGGQRVEALSPELRAIASDMNTQAGAAVAVSTFTNENVASGFIRDVRNGKTATKYPVIRGVIDFFAPFKQIPGALAGATVKMAPTGLLGVGDSFLQWYKAVNTGAAPEEIRALQRSLSMKTGYVGVGSGIIAGGSLLHRNGLMTSFKPTEEQRREGALPYSVKFGGKWIPIAELAPIGPLLAMGAEWDANGLPEASRHFADEVSKMTLLRGSGDAQDVFGVNGGRDQQKAWNSLAGSMVPTIVGQIAQGSDGVQRTPRNPVEAIEARIPGLRENVPAKIDPASGQPVRTGPGGAAGVGKAIVDFTHSRDPRPANPRVAQAMNDIGFDVPALKKEPGETDEAFQARQARVGQAVGRAVEQALGNARPPGASEPRARTYNPAVNAWQSLRRINPTTLLQDRPEVFGQMTKEEIIQYRKNEIMRSLVRQVRSHDSAARRAAVRKQAARNVAARGNRPLSGKAP